MNIKYREVRFFQAKNPVRLSLFIGFAVLLGGLFLSSCKKSVVGSTTTTVLQAPTISSLDGGAASITVNWAPVTGASYYNLYYAADTTVSKVDGRKNSGGQITIYNKRTGRQYKICRYRDRSKYIR